MLEHLVAIDPEGTAPVEARWFGADGAAARAWADQWNDAGRNVYWTVAVVRPGLHSKPSKADILWPRYAHVDIDPPKGATLDKAATVRALQGDPRPPTLVIDSGNGIQALWALETGCTVPDVEAINRALIDRWGGDPVAWNADRLLRLPATVNWPNERKRAQGRVPCLATLVVDEPGRVYRAADFPRRERAQPGRAEIGLDDWDGAALDPETVEIPTRIREMLPAVWEDRSAHLAAVAIALASAGVPLVVAAGLLVEHPHVLDNGPRSLERALGLAEPHRPRPAAEAFAVPAVLPAGAGAAAHGVPPPPGPPVNGGARNAGVMLADEQQRLFAGCVYVRTLHAIRLPSGAALRPEQFNVEFGGPRFVVDLEGAKSVDEAWKAATRNARYSLPIADALCFRPERPAGELVREDGRWLVNDYVPIETPRRAGDASPFLNHLARMIPDARDREILLTWMGRCVRSPGVKAQWWPFVQGTKGNGKTMLLEVMAECVGRRYAHVIDVGKAARNGINFNSWIQSKLFLGLDEVYTAERRAFLQELKPYVTNLTLPIEGKGKDVYMGDNRANGITLSNEKDGLPLDPDERRYAPFFTAQQSRADMARDGLVGDYFPRLWAWLRAEGFAIVNDHLRTRELVAEFDPLTCARAPITTSWTAALAAGRGRAEQEVLELIEQGAPGFAGGLVSSIMLGRALEGARVALARDKRTALMASLGYSLHPALPDGRATVTVQPDGGKPRLYVRDGHPIASAATAALVLEHYQRSNSGIEARFAG